MRRFSVALFDWDGTLFDSRNLLYLASTSIFVQFGVSPPTSKVYFSEMSGNYTDYYYSHGIPRSASREDLCAIRKEFVLSNWHLALPFDDTLATLRYLKKEGLVVGIVSAESTELLERRLEEAGLDALLDYYVGSVHDKKIVILDMLKILETSPENCFYVEDTAKVIPRIKESGVFTIGITRGFGTPQEIAEAQPDLIVSSLQKIVEFVDGDI